MSVSINADKTAIQAILRTDPYLLDYLNFDPNEIYTVKATDALLTQDENKQQIFIYNNYPEPTVNPLVWGIVYEILVSTPTEKSGTADLAIEQIQALLNGTKITNTSTLEILDMPVVMTSETSLYQIAMRFVTYNSTLNKPKAKPKS